MERITPQTFLKDAEAIPSVHSEVTCIAFPIPIALQQQVEDFAGWVLRPHDANGFMIAFDFGGVHMSQRELRILRSFLNEELIPFATIGDFEALLLITPENSAFCVGLDSGDVSYLGELQDAIPHLLKGTVMEIMIPVLPVRPHSQWHNMTVYDPKQPGVYWVEASEWIFEKPADEDDRLLYGGAR